MKLLRFKDVSKEVWNLIMECPCVECHKRSENKSGLKKHHEAVQVKDVSKEVWNHIDAEKPLWRVP